MHYLLLLVILSSCTTLKDYFGEDFIVDDFTLNNQSNEILQDRDLVKKNKLTQSLKKFCNELDDQFERYSWNKSGCQNFRWNHVRNSVKGRPLAWFTHGVDEKSLNLKKSVLLMCGVHGDEITSVKFCFDMFEDIRASNIDFSDKLLVVVPLVNPDAFFKKRPTRTNGNGVDINRNFPTKDFKKRALYLWKHRYKKDKRRFPGFKAMSEPEVLFQVNLITRYKPDMIISVHAPLTMLDYDGPGDSPKSRQNGNIWPYDLLIQMSKKAKDYKIINYPFFPGSLGNWAGNERKIPTYTLELPSTDNRRTEEYRALFKDSMINALSGSFSKK